MTTEQRESEMNRLKRISEVMRRLEAELPGYREIELGRLYPNMPRERKLRIVASEEVSK